MPFEIPILRLLYAAVILDSLLARSVLAGLVLLGMLLYLQTNLDQS
jgi:hypothetical protein